MEAKKKTSNRFSPEVREWAARMVLEHRKRDRMTARLYAAAACGAFRRQFHGNISSIRLIG